MFDMTHVAIDAVRSAKRGDTSKAAEVLRQSVVALADVLNGVLPDAERSIYLQHLKESLEDILTGAHPAELALGLRSGSAGAPNKDTFDRDYVLFRQVGESVSKSANGRITVTQAYGLVAKRAGVSISTVKNAWQHFGASDGWKRTQQLENQS